MIKSKSTFKLSKPSKSLIASIVDKDHKIQFKNAMVQAEISAGIQPKVNKNRKEEKSE